MVMLRVGQRWEDPFAGEAAEDPEVVAGVEAYKAADASDAAMRALVADDSAQSFAAQAHAFAVKSGEDRELIKVLLRRLLRELEGGA